MDKRARSFDIVLGVSTDGKEITLVDCLELRGTLIARLQTSSLYVGRCFVGAHFQKPDDIRFRQASARYSYLDDWVGISGFDIELTGDVTTMRYRPPSSIETNVGQEYGLAIDFAYSGPTMTRPVQRKVRMTQTTWITIRSQQERPLDEYLNVLFRIQNLLSLAVSEPVSLLELQGETEVRKTEFDGHTIYDPVRIYCRQLTAPAERSSFIWFDMLFRFEDISDRFHAIIENWFKNLEQLRSSVDLYFASLYNPKMYLEHKFLSVVQALESYHRLKVRRNEWSDEEHKIRIDEIMRAAPTQYKEWLDRELDYSNELSLRARLKELLNRHATIAGSSADDRSEFVNDVVDTRNYLTHYDPKLKDRAATGHRLFTLTRKLRILLEACLLEELGFARDEIRGLFQKSRKYADLLPILKSNTEP